MSNRPYIPLKKRLASALLTMRVEENGKLVPFIDHETAKKLTADQIISLFNFDHYPIAKWMGGCDEPWNLRPMPIMPHREKSAKYDTPNSAKADRVTEEHERFRKVMLAKSGQGEAPQKPRSRLRKPEGHGYDWKQRRYVEVKD